MISLTLLHPTKSVPIQSWTFESESVIKIGRSTDNHVVMYSAVVSRHHLELINKPEGWEIVNYGTNGTYVEGEPIAQAAVVDGMVIRLGESGPKIRIRIGVADPNASRTQPRSPGSRQNKHKEQVTFITNPQRENSPESPSE
ncbi:FHA domain-containing protein [Oscillatoria salina]|uniref:FHA domain-containing protein n=1 Tax=Oscillatoria salina TaxID=331517 RepID=UPI0013B97B7C|nr:FHA domain-containing protein [Oscillatoria salina]MBZ8181000.1 FHA domain-containing protein [Oscillatoria salina IIICB1]NET88121.1 FHA domain-containing protein [Kamptonema sp. SIO1D9]